MRSLFLPVSKPGRWSIALSIVFALGLAGFALAFVALLRNRENAILLLLPILGGGLVMFWIMTRLA